MASIYFGQIDLTKLGKIAKQHPQLVKKVNFKDGEHQLLNISIHLKPQPDQWGNAAFVKADCKKDEEVQGVNYFIGDLKKSTRNEQPQTPSWDKPLPKIEIEDDGGDLPFN